LAALAAEIRAGADQAAARLTPHIEELATLVAKFGLIVVVAVADRADHPFPPVAVVYGLL
jgi:hypothetical protein